MSSDIAAASLAEARARVYGFLSRVLLEPPSETLLSPFREPELLDSFRSLIGEHALDYFQGISKLGAQDLAPLVQEYNDLFVVPLGRYVTPYEAVYRGTGGVRGKKGLLMGASTVAVLQSFKQAGVKASDDFLDLPDHAGLELSFMCYLCNKQAEALNRGDNQQSSTFFQMQKSFLEEHLACWIPGLCTRIFDNAQELFYKGVAKLIEAFIASEAETLAQIGTSTS